ncbi:arginine--tRNA ligase [Jeotgalibacillus haloalkalitolerans]|uniref:Arginine--tRNA ligase n=1 Tax=Jeotgalibacillus haloalkalitolerans TaxID=3104292 RepID=A0ABU5KJ63_9BACL|nr:arginine--tRNA ligase [Jeotgalibacillus sp. HH7-29]MDZ5710760.1 arginine--tRNA ligase [Jeotgalibacillus sp. HH7-29]
MDYQSLFAEALYQQLRDQLDQEKVYQLIEKPKFTEMGDFAFPCFELAKIFRKAPNQIASDLAEKLELPPLFEKVEAVGGYVNVFLDQTEVSGSVVAEVIQAKDHYGTMNHGNGEVITIDFSSPNIAKPFSMGHLRSTVIGHSLARIAEKNGFEVVRINHLGDWGTQFGKLIAAYKLWGNEEKIREKPIKELLKLYVQFHDEAERDPSLIDEGRLWFKRLEDGDQEAHALWEWFRDESLKEFNSIYELLGVTFDSTQGEAFYNDKMDRVVQLLEEKKLLEESDGALVVQTAEGMPPCLIKKKDGTTLYATRDLAAAIYRHEIYGSERSLYVVGNEQTLHFKQLFLVLEKMGYEWSQGLKHVPFGMMLKDGKKMSTRKGKVVLLEEVLKEAVSLAQQNIADKNPSLPDQERVAHQVGTGAVIFHDLKNHRLNDVEFSLDAMLKFEGETGPYVQYTHARASSILRKASYRVNAAQLMFSDDTAWAVVKCLMGFPEAVTRAFEGNDPSQIAKYVLELAKSFNQYYGNVRILDAVEGRQEKLSLVHAVQIVLKEGMYLLGLEAPEEM